MPVELLRNFFPVKMVGMIPLSTGWQTTARGQLRWLLAFVNEVLLERRDACLFACGLWRLSLHDNGAE